ncbi:hypothetical protein [Rhizobium laguerreae]|uniref:hypothetical protein n=1 Tax=Rhizobium laguerreae TaxID=1076926 RepID=UPI001C91C325|nr:hypothetical protein [Rhizobium laguerreae]MBY3556433.1 hypothetical protein [Rhizobium laguerreae]
MKTLVIECESVNSGEIFLAHCPEPFPMGPAEYQAFAVVFSAWERRRWLGIGDVQVSDRRASAALVDALRGLGYHIVNRGTIPPDIE